MARPASETPTPRELELLQVYWAAGKPLTAEETRQGLAERRDLHYATVRNLSQILEEKGYLRQVGNEIPILHGPARSREDVTGAIVVGPSLVRVRPTPIPGERSSRWPDTPLGRASLTQVRSLMQGNRRTAAEPTLRKQRQSRSRRPRGFQISKTAWLSFGRFDTGPHKLEAAPGPPDNSDGAASGKVACQPAAFGGRVGA
jgi:hypothetical protein